MTCSEWNDPNLTDAEFIKKLIAENAHFLSEQRETQGISGDKDTDWEAASRYVFHRWPGPFQNQEEIPVPNLESRLDQPSLLGYLAQVTGKVPVLAA